MRKKYEKRIGMMKAEMEDLQQVVCFVFYRIYIYDNVVLILWSVYLIGVELICQARSLVCFVLELSW